MEHTVNNVLTVHTFLFCTGTVVGLWVGSKFTAWRWGRRLRKAVPV